MRKIITVLVILAMVFIAEGAEAGGLEKYNIVEDGKIYSVKANCSSDACEVLEKEEIPFVWNQSIYENEENVLMVLYTDGVWVKSKEDDYQYLYQIKKSITLSKDELLKLGEEL